MVRCRGRDGGTEGREREEEDGVVILGASCLFVYLFCCFAIAASVVNLCDCCSHSSVCCGREGLDEQSFV